MLSLHILMYHDYLRLQFKKKSSKSHVNQVYKVLLSISSKPKPFPNLLNRSSWTALLSCSVTMYKPNLLYSISYFLY